MTDVGREQAPSYGATYRADYGFERHQVASRRRLLLRLIDELRPSRVVETGCGWELLAEAVASTNVDIARWVVVEPDPVFAARARALSQRMPCLRIVEATAEAAVDEVSQVAEGDADLVICSSLLHEVAKPAELLASCKRMLGGTGTLHVNVPNARSLHRRLARAAGLITAEADLSDRNIALEQPRVFDNVSLREVVTAAGFEVETSGGYMLKPFTHAQMEACDFLTGQLLSGLFVLGEELPDLASEIYVNARPLAGP